MKRKILGFLGVIMMVFVGATVMVPTPAMALGGGNCGQPGFLGFKPWYAGLCDGNSSNSDIKAPEQGDEADLAAFIWTIVLNVLVDLMVAISYLAIGFIIYGGYLYIMSQGDPGKAMRGKKTITNAIIGTIVALVASVTVNTVRVILGINTSDSWKNEGFNAESVQNIFSWAYTAAGIVAVIFIIKNAVDYMLSQGDPGKTRKATQGIIYAVVGLIVVLLAAAITTFVINSTNGAMAQ